MLRFRKILLCDVVFYGIFLVAFLLTIVRVNIKKNSYYSTSSSEAVGMITSIEEKDKRVVYHIKAKEDLIVTIRQSNSYHLGDLVKIKGSFQIPESNSNRNLWSYRDYLEQRNIHYIIQADSIILMKRNHNLYYKFKQFLIHSLHQNPYLFTFVLGDKSFLSSEVIRSFQENGISHLFAISGMHISLLAALFEKVLKKIFYEEKRFLITSLFLFGYLLLVGFTPSMLRGVLFYVLFRGNSIYYFYVKKENIFLLILSISLFINPYYIYDLGFQYSYLISFALIRTSSFLQSISKWRSLLKVSCLSFFVSIPITIKNYNQLNLLSILFNMFYVPYVSSVVFPFSLLTLFIKLLEPLYHFCTMILEKTSLFLMNIPFGKLYWKQMPNWIYWIYLGLILCYLLFQKRWILYLFFIVLFFHYTIPFFDHSSFINVLDVGQGDSTLLKLSHKSILIDTGGKGDKGMIYYNVINPTLKKEGIRKLDYLILTHGDFDHMGEAINLVSHFKVEKVIFNCGEFNDLEKEFIKVLDKKKIKYYSCIQELNIDDNKLYFLQTKEYDNENDNSNVIYIELNGYKFMLMGDAGVEKEKDILDEYNISNIDVLKVGHHGSKTSSCKKFINEINPKYSIISVGKNNRYGHPNNEVLDNLEDSKIYRTDQDGSIMLQIKNNKLKIETCRP